MLPLLDIIKKRVESDSLKANFIDKRKTTFSIKEIDQIVHNHGINMKKDTIVNNDKKNNSKNDIKKLEIIRKPDKK